jgi:hypothetical protein
MGALFQFQLIIHFIKGEQLMRMSRHLTHNLLHGSLTASLTKINSA